MYISGVTFGVGSYPAAIAFGADPAATDAITIGAQVYTYDATPSAAYEVDVGATRDESISNLVAAINGDLTGTPAHPHVRATADLANDEIDLQAFGGAAANFIPLVSSETDITVAAATLGAVSGATLATGDLGAWVRGFLDNAQLYSAAISDLEQNLAGSLL